MGEEALKIEAGRVGLGMGENREEGTENWGPSPHLVFQAKGSVA